MNNSTAYFKWLCLPHSHLLFAGALALSLLNATSSSATPFRYLFEGQGEATIGGVFEETVSGPFEIELLADTDEIGLFPAAIGNLHFLDGQGTVTLPAGNNFPGGDFSIPVSLNITLPFFSTAFTPFINLISFTTLPPPSRSFSLSYTDSAFDGFMLDSTLGPVVSTNVNFDNGDSGIQLNVGDLNFNTISQLTFTATAVPEPGTPMLIAVGLIIFALLHGKRPSGDHKTGRPTLC